MIIMFHCVCFIQSKCDRECFDVSKELGQLPSECWSLVFRHLILIWRYFTGTRTSSLPGLISSFRVTLILGNLLRLKNETAVLGAVEVLKCDQNIDAAAIILMFQLPTL